MTVRRYEYTRDGTFMCWFVTSGDVVTTVFVADDNSGDCEAQTADCLRQADEYLAIAGTDKSRLLWAQVFIKDMSHYAAHARAWNAWVDPENPPARACVTHDMYAPECLVEIKLAAALPTKTKTAV
jgi:enamine deaminase RidA (YjgF/YER057c/UK114 family)